MEQQIKINNAWQRVRLNIPNMMQIFNANKKNISSCGELWEKIQETTDVNAIIDAVEDLAEVNTETAKKWVYERLAVDTWRGGMMQEYAISLINAEGWDARTANEQEDKQGIDLVAVKDGQKINIQIKPISFFKCTNPICKYKRALLFDKCHDNNIYIMIYDGDIFVLNDKNKYLHDVKTLMRLWQK